MPFSTTFAINYGRIRSAVSLLLILTSCTKLPALAADLAPVLHTTITLPTSGRSAGSRYDFGSLSSYQVSPLSHTFVLQNHAQLPMTITEMRPACGCTSTPLGQKAKMPFTLPPGQQASVRVVLDTTNLPAGPFTKSVWVYIQGQDAPAATLEMTGTVLPAALLSPTTLVFGHTAFGKSPTLSVTVTWNTQPLPGGSQYHLISTNPEVQITPELPSDQDAKPPVTAALTLALSSAAKRQTQTYRCTLSSQAHLGELQGYVDAVVVVPGAGQVVVGSVPLRGDVSGDVAASPAVVAFGTIRAGQGVSRQTRLTLAQAMMPTVSSPCPYLTAQLHPLITGHPDAPFGGGTLGTRLGHTTTAESDLSQALIDITLSSNAPVGPLETELTVITQSGQRLRVPIFAMIVPAEAKR